jgi:diguanylate cyclase (GGDEF)-like protein
MLLQPYLTDHSRDNVIMPESAINPKPTILYIDDEQDNLDVFKSTFRPYYKIHTALNAVIGGELLKKESIDLIVSDQRMPIMTGIDFFHSIVPVYPDIMRILLTAYSDVNAAIDSINKAKVYRYIVKPWEEEELKNAIDQALAYQHLNRKNKELLEYLAEYNKTLEYKVAERTEELRRVNESLMRANEAAEMIIQDLKAVNEEKSRLLVQTREQAILLENLARQDVLTRLANRRYLETSLRYEFERAKRYGRALSVAILDVDHFKKVNDTFSHQTGDEVLRRLGAILPATIRASDLAARYGGEEFVLVFSDTALDAATKVCENICKAIESYNWKEIHPELSLSCSIGVSADTTVPNFEKMLSLADEKLYEAKRNGRNQVRA